MCIWGDDGGLIFFLRKTNKKLLQKHVEVKCILRFNYWLTFGSFELIYLVPNTIFIPLLSFCWFTTVWDSQVVLVVKNPPAHAGDSRDTGSSLGLENPLEKEMVTHSSVLAWEIPWTAEPGRLRSMGSQRLRHQLATEQRLFHTI